MRSGADPNLVSGGLPLIHVAAMSPKRHKNACCHILKMLLKDTRVDPNTR